MTTCKETLLIMNIQTFTHHLKDKLSFIHSFVFFFKVKLTFFFLLIDVMSHIEVCWQHCKIVVTHFTTLWLTYFEYINKVLKRLLSN